MAILISSSNYPVLLIRHDDGFLRPMLQQGGFDVHCVNDETSALGKLKNWLPALILLDQFRGNPNEFRLLDHIRSQEHLRHVPVILLTSYSDQESDLAALGYNDVHCIIKPFDPQSLIDCIYKQMRPVDGSSLMRSGAEVMAERAQMLLRVAEERFTVLVRNSYDLVCELNRDLLITYAGSNYRDILGYDPSGLIHQHWIELLHPDDEIRVKKHLQDMFLSMESTRISMRFKHAEGEWRWLDMCADIQNPLDAYPRLLLVARDISQAKEVELRLKRMAFYDALTGVGNRNRLAEKLQSTLASYNGTVPGALVCIDVDNFKMINDSNGHAIGDETLRSIARILRANFGKPHTVCRHGGDEFSVLLHNVDEAEAGAQAQSLMTNVQSVTVSGGAHSFGITLSAGVAMIESGMSSEELMARADIALYAAKTSGKNCYCLYRTDSEEMTRIRSDADWFPKIWHGLAAGQFRVYYQPVFDLRTNRVLCYEALLRYEDEDGLIHLPGAFLPSAERYNLMGEVDRYVISKVIEDLQRVPKLRVAINLSGQSIHRATVGEYVINALESSEIDPQRVLFEITETVFISDLQKAAKLVNMLRAAGCLIALDDFGSGFSSLRYLRNLPVDIVKIDGSFVEKIERDEVDFALMRSINEIAHMLGKCTVAEYVSNERVSKMLSDIGVDYGQGYFLGGPKPLEAFAA